MEISIQDLYHLFTSKPVICTDTRNIKDNSIFFSLKGEKYNGNKFAEIALQQGADFAVVDEEKYVKDNRYILVDNVLKTLQELAKYHREKLNIPVIAITGTNGKTTTKELINLVLSKKYKTFASYGNFNNHIGVPLTILSINNNTDIAVVEMGANHIKEISQLCDIAQPNFGIITNIGKAHIEGFGNIEQIIKAKNELYEYIAASKGRLFVNIKNDLLLNLSKDIPKTTYGETSDADCRGIFLGINPYVKLNWIYDDKSHIIQSQLIGSYNFENILSAVCVGNYFKVNHKSIKQAIESYKPVNNRSQVLKTKGNLIILDAYNANPISMEAAIDNFKIIPYKNKIAIIGDMLELGSESIKEHKRIIKLLEDANFKKIILVGEIFFSLCNNSDFQCFENTDKALQFLKKNHISSASILIKGSRKMELERLTEVL